MQMENAVAAGTIIGTIGLMTLKSAGPFLSRNDSPPPLDMLKSQARVSSEAEHELMNMWSERIAPSVTFVPAFALVLRGESSSDGTSARHQYLEDGFLESWSRDRLAGFRCHLLSAAGWPSIVYNDGLCGCGAIKVWCGSKPISASEEKGTGLFLIAEIKRGVWCLDAKERPLQDPFAGDLIAFGVQRH